MQNISIIVPSLAGGGAERIAGYLSVYLSNIYNVYIFIRYIDRVKYEYKGTLVPISEAGNGKELSTEVALRILKKKYKIIIAISFMENCNFANILSKGNEMVVVSERSSYSQKKPRKLIAEGKIKSLYNKADSIVACSYGVKHCLIQDYCVCSNRIHTIYNFLDKETNRSLAKEQMPENVINFLNGSDYFISVGRFHPLKRIDYLIEQFIIFKEQNDIPIKLIIMGDGSEKDKFEKLISNNCANDYIKIIPPTTNPFLYIRRAKALLVASEYEGLPNVILESFSVGVPVISTDCFSGPRELLEDEHDYSKLYDYPKVCKRGLLINPNVRNGNTDDSDLQYAMSMMCKDDELFSGMKQNIKLYMENYSNQSILDAWIKVLDKKNNKEKEDLYGSSYYEDNISRVLNEANNIYIYGTGVYGERAYNTYASDFVINGFLSSYAGDNDTIFDLKIFNINNIKIKETDCIILGVSEDYEDEVYDILKSKGCTNIVHVY